MSLALSYNNLEEEINMTHYCIKKLKFWILQKPIAFSPLYLQALINTANFMGLAKSMFPPLS